MALAWQETDGSLIVVRTTIDGASPGVLWRLWTEPDGLTSWWSDRADVDLAGRTLHFEWPGMDWHLRGRILEWLPERRLTFTWRWDHEPTLPERTVAVELEPIAEGAGTLLTLRHGTYGEGDLEAADRQSHIDGWNYFLPRLEAAAQLRKNLPSRG